MKKGKVQLNLFNTGTREIIVDNFAGGGGASTGIELATGRSVDIAINHDPAAIAMHQANHPTTEHYCESVWDVDPKKATFGRPVSLCWLSPDCKHFSKAKGGKPVEKTIRGLAWVAVRWAATVRPRVIMLENVEEFKTWGPLLKDGMPDKDKKGRTFQAFVNALKRQGYQVEWRELRACDYGAPTIRKRFFLVARCDGQPIVWPEPTHGGPESKEVKSGRLKPWRTAADIIDWSLPCPSIFERKKPLAENTMRRIARGIFKFVLGEPEPFVINLQAYKATRASRISSPFVARIGQTGFGGDRMQYDLKDPLTTITTKAEHLLISPTLIQTGFGEREGQAPRVPGLDKPLGTVVAGGQKHALVAAFLAQYHTETASHEARGQTLDKPILTLDTSNRYGLVTSHLMILRNNQFGQEVTKPIPTVTAGGGHVGEVRAFLTQYNGSSIGQRVDAPCNTISTHDRFGLVTVHGQDYQIVDIGMRMLEPHELFAAQGFPEDYIIDRDLDGNKYPKSAQVARCGNAVPPPFAEHLVRANLPELCAGMVGKRKAVN